MNIKRIIGWTLAITAGTTAAAISFAALTTPNTAFLYAPFSCAALAVLWLGLDLVAESAPR